MSRARAHANIALVKYWGKRDAALNIPAAGSLSLTLEALTTETEVTFGRDRDSLVLDGAETGGKPLARLSAWLDLIRAGRPLGGARVVSTNNFPTASGLASSASAYAALAVAASAAAGDDLDPTRLSILARRGSGSAARSIFGGLVLMHGGARADGRDAHAASLASQRELADWPLAMVVAVIGGGVAKKVSSRDAMDHSAATSPLYRAWIDCVDPDLAAATKAIADRDLDALGAICQHSALAMHAAAMASRPPIVYFKPATLAVLERVGELAADRPAFYTMDAGPHVKVLTLAEHADEIGGALATIDGVTGIIVSGVGGPAALGDPS